MARSHLVDIRAQISKLQRMAAELDRVIGGCSKEQRANCAILGTLMFSLKA